MLSPVALLVDQQIHSESVLSTSCYRVRRVSRKTFLLPESCTNASYFCLLRRPETQALVPIPVPATRLLSWYIS